MHSESHVLATPMWVFGIRIAQVVLSIVVLGLCAAWTGWGINDAPALGIAAAVFTWFIVAYQLVSEKVAAARSMYHVLAVLALDLYMIIIWLCTWALNAARAAQWSSFNNDYDDLFDSGDNCYFGICAKKRSVEKRTVRFKTLKGLLGGTAGVGAIIWVLFIATFVWTVLRFLGGRKDGRFPLKPVGGHSGHVEEGKVAPGQQQPISSQPTGQEQYQQQPVQPQYTGQEQYQQQMQPEYAGHEQYQQQTVPAEHAGHEQYPPQPIPAEYNSQDPNQVAPQHQQHHQQ